MSTILPEGGIPALSGSVDIEDNSLFFSDLEQTKGFEFDYVCIVNCKEGVIPDLHLPMEEHFRELSRLYVAMTRAKLELIISYSDTASSLFRNVSDYLIKDEWVNYTDKSMNLYKAPKKMADIVHQEDIDISDATQMTGQMFLYSKQAIGLSAGLIDILRNRVTGRSGKERLASGYYKIISWENIGELINDLKRKSAFQHKVHKRFVKEALTLDVD